ncbi:MAG: aromatic ring-hydroxylating dioxygenase subunit alpha [Proteobacteria bacterium]|nr:aromatic ring-hydroxylating dioxygenase subunit alpha [Pseudomonadota bacterium]
MDTGTAYGLPAPTWKKELTEVGPGTPMGELLRRYWHPVGLAADAGSIPRKVRALGEDLVLFRDGLGRAGLVYPHCAHRGASLYYGKTEAQGIRCCYHGWLFDTEGHCLEQPCEAGGGPRRDKVRQPWYPVKERYGLVYAYMGPPEKKPLLPRYECLEVLAEGEFIDADDSSIGSGGAVIAPCNWLQHYENVVDPFHVPILHGSFSGAQFTSQMASMPQVQFSTTALGVKVTSQRMMEDGRIFHRVTEAAVPTLRVVPNPRVGTYGMVESIGWVLPIDDTSYRIYTAGRVTEKGGLTKFRSRFNGKSWAELTEEEHQRYPGDYETQVSQGPIAHHSEEHFATSDKGIALLRRFLEQQLKAVAAGADPAGTAFGEEAAYVRFEAGNFLI